MIVRPITAKIAAIPTNQLPSTPDTTARNQPFAPPISR